MHPPRRRGVCAACAGASSACPPVYSRCSCGSTSCDTRIVPLTPSSSNDVVAAAVAAAVALSFRLAPSARSVLSIDSMKGAEKRRESSSRSRSRNSRRACYGPLQLVTGR